MNPIERELTPETSPPEPDAQELDDFLLAVAAEQGLTGIDDRDDDEDDDAAEADPDGV